MLGNSRLAAATWALALACALPAAAHQELHRIEGRLVAGTATPRNVRVRLVLRDGLRPVGETVTRGDGRFLFQNLAQGDYIVEVEETDEFQAAQTVVEVRKLTLSAGESLGANEKPEEHPGKTFYVSVHMLPKAQPTAVPSVGSIAADVDVDVPAKAREHYDRAIAKRSAGDPSACISELKKAIAAHGTYYAARLELGRELRRVQKFDDARDALEPLRKIAPRRAEPLVELGIALMGLGERERAAEALTASLALDETNWSAHLYLGYALVDVKDQEAEPHFWRALQINEREAAPAHLALARLAHRYGFFKEAVEQLEAYLRVVPDAHDAGDVRKLAERLRKQIPPKQP